jgi:hypothetical protein
MNKLFLFISINVKVLALIANFQYFKQYKSKSIIDSNNLNVRLNTFHWNTYIHVYRKIKLDTLIFNRFYFIVQVITLRLTYCHVSS